MMGVDLQGTRRGDPMVTSSCEVDPNKGRGGPVSSSDGKIR